MSPTAFFAIFAVVLFVGFVIGLLVGRRNPSIANTVATLAEDAKATGAKVVASVKDGKT